MPGRLPTLFRSSKKARATRWWVVVEQLEDRCVMSGSPLPWNPPDHFVFGQSLGDLSFADQRDSHAEIRREPGHRSPADVKLRAESIRAAYAMLIDTSAAEDEIDRFETSRDTEMPMGPSDLVGPRADLIPGPASPTVDHESDPPVKTADRAEGEFAPPALPIVVPPVALPIANPHPNDGSEEGTNSISNPEGGTLVTREPVVLSPSAFESSNFSLGGGSSAAIQDRGFAAVSDSQLASVPWSSTMSPARTDVVSGIAATGRLSDSLDRSDWADESGSLLEVDARVRFPALRPVPVSAGLAGPAGSERMRIRPFTNPSRSVAGSPMQREALVDEIRSRSTDAWFADEGGMIVLSAMPNTQTVRAVRRLAESGPVGMESAVGWHRAFNLAEADESAEFSADQERSSDPATVGESQPASQNPELQRAELGSDGDESSVHRADGGYWMGLAVLLTWIRDKISPAPTQAVPALAAPAAQTARRPRRLAVAK